MPANDGWSRRALLRTGAAVAAGLAVGCDSAGAKEDTLEDGTALYRAAKFPEAQQAYQREADADPDDVEALAGAGAIALLSNRLDEAAGWLERAIDVSPNHVPALRDLAEVAYRRDDFPAATAWLRRLAENVDGAERDGSEVVARKLAAFAAARPYRIDRDPGQVRVPFLATDPLPVLNVTVGDGPTVPFFIDTGGHEVYLDQALASTLGVPVYGTAPGAGAGGKQAIEGHGRLNALTLGALRVNDIPIKTLDFASLGFAQALGGIEVQGVIGTAFLYHFLATIDYAHGALILRPRTPDRLRPFEQQANRRDQHIVPFWLSGTHFILAWGTVNDSDPTLLFADTGGAGLGFAATKSTVERARIRLQHDQAISGAGAGGTAQAIPFTVDKLTLGTAEAKDLSGVYFPETDLERDLGRDFPIGGIISHQFFRPYALTLDFTGMRLFLTHQQ